MFRRRDGGKGTLLTARSVVLLLAVLAPLAPPAPGLLAVFEEPESPPAACCDVCWLDDELDEDADEAPLAFAVVDWALLADEVAFEADELAAWPADDDWLAALAELEEGDEEEPAGAVGWLSAAISLLLSDLSSLVTNLLVEMCC